MAVIGAFVKAAALSVGLAPLAQACAFHSYTPDPTLVDILLGSEHVVLAQIDPADAGRYVAVQALMGPLEHVAIPVPVDADTRAALGASNRVLFARDGAYGPWQKLAVLDDDFRDVIAKVIQRQAAWSLGDDQDRYQTFARHLRHRNPELRRLALLELDRADYGLLRQLNLPEMPGLGTAIDTGDPDLRPIRILIAGLSQDKDLLGVLSNKMTSAVQADAPYLGAYATALIELGGAGGLEELQLRYLMDENLSVATREKIAEALAIQGQNGSKLIQKAVHRAAAETLAQSPELAAAFARQFGFRADFSLGEELRAAAIARAPTELDDIFAVNQYLGIAAREIRTTD